MAAFLAKQMVGNQLSAVKDIGVADNMSAEEKERLAQIEKERLEALREQEERRKEKHQKMEEEREKLRKGIRDKYNIKKQEAPNPSEADNMLAGQDGFNVNRLNDDGTTAMNGEGEELDDLTKLKNNIEQRFAELRNTIEARCTIS